MTGFKPCWSCRSTGKCYAGCECARCRDPQGYDKWRVENRAEYTAWLVSQQVFDNSNQPRLDEGDWRKRLTIDPRTMGVWLGDEYISIYEDVRDGHECRWVRLSLAYELKMMLIWGTRYGTDLADLDCPTYVLVQVSEPYHVQPEGAYELKPEARWARLLRDYGRLSVFETSRLIDQLMKVRALG